MNVLLKQAKDMLVVLFGTIGLMLVLFPLIIMITVKKGALKSWHGLVVKIKKHDAQSLFSYSFSTGANQIAKEGD